MDDALNNIERLLLKTNGLAVSGITEDRECPAYSGCSFQIGNRSILFRNAKCTPKKKGHFVTLWKRDAQKQTQPFELTDAIDFYMIAAARQHQSGFFFFPKSILGEKGILTVGNKQGKRGFRVYTDWDFYLNKQAQRTKDWQTNYFIDLTEVNNTDASGFIAIMNQY
ncbi:MepB family protein [Niabella sp.]|uniref:MepB family protein n=1 Tax=Niabella sp. TaxID=1962976 RepID=UPI00262C2F9C|nr:MepB family protein [Niabella sp.]